MDKFSRINFLKKCGVNTPDYTILKSADDIKKTKVFKKYKELSLRTQPTKEIPKQLRDEVVEILSAVDSKLDISFPPHFPVISSELAERICPILFKYDLDVIVCGVINPKDAVWAGACLVDKNNNLFIEIAKGQVMVRKVTVEGKFDVAVSIYGKSYLSEVQDDTIWVLGKEIYDKIPLKNCVFEVSWYNKPIGWKRHNLIFWDVMDDGTGKSKLG